MHEGHEMTSARTLCDAASSKESGEGLMLKKFKDLTEKEILALAISSEEEDGRIYGEFADALRESYPATATMFEEMREEEVVHRDRLLAMFRQRFGDHIPLIRRENVKGFLARRPNWLVRPLGVNVARRQAEVMELEAQRFYQRAIARTTDVSTLAPLFAAAFATHKTWDAFLVGLAASVGAGISMGFAESLSDDGSLTGRGSPWIRGAATGLMTTAGGIGHTLPFLIKDFRLAMTVAIVVVLVELGTISFVRHKYMDTPFLQAAFQVVVGGVLVFFTGYLIGSS